MFRKNLQKNFEGIINCAAYTNVNKAEFDIDKGNRNK